MEKNFHIHRHPAFHNGFSLRLLLQEAILLQDPGLCLVLRKHLTDYALQLQFLESKLADLPDRFRTDALGSERRQNHIANRPDGTILINHPLHRNTADNLAVHHDSPPNSLIIVILSPIGMSSPRHCTAPSAYPYQQ